MCSSALLGLNTPHVQLYMQTTLDENWRGCNRAWLEHIEGTTPHTKARLAPGPPRVQLLPEAPYRQDRRKAEVLLEKTHIVDSLVLLCFNPSGGYTMTMTMKMITVIWATKRQDHVVLQHITCMTVANAPTYEEVKREKRNAISTKCLTKCHLRLMVHRSSDFELLAIGICIVIVIVRVFFLVFRR